MPDPAPAEPLVPSPYRRKADIVQAVCWTQYGEHAAVLKGSGLRCGDPDCAATTKQHGWLRTPSGGRVVCPGDYVITDVAGQIYVVDSETFAALYEPNV